MLYLIVEFYITNQLCCKAYQ